MNERELTLLFRIRDMATKEINTAKGAIERMKSGMAAAGTEVGYFAKKILTSKIPLVEFLTNLKSIIAAIAALMALRAAVSTMRDLVNEMDRIGKLSSELKISTETLSALSKTVSLVGLDADVLTVSLRKLNVQIGMARAGNADLIKVFNQLGVSLTSPNGSVRSTDEILLDVADGVAKISSASERARVSARLFGEDAGPRLLNLLSQGSAGIAQMTREAERFGVVMDRDAVKKAEALNDSITRLGLSFDGLKMASIQPGFGDITDSLNAIAGFVADNRQGIADIVNYVSKSLVQSLRLVFNLVELITKYVFQMASPEQRDLVNRLFRAIWDNVFYYTEVWRVNIKNAILGAINDAIAGIVAAYPGFAKTLGLTGNFDQAKAIPLEAMPQQPWTSVTDELGYIMDVYGRSGGTGGGVLKQVADEAADMNMQIEKSAGLFTQLGRGFSGGFAEIKANMLDLAGNVQGVVTSAFSTLQGAATSAVEGMIDGSLKASDAMKQFGRAIITTLISVAAQLAVMIPLFLLFDTLSGGTLAAAGAANTAAAVGSVGGLLGSFFGGTASGSSGGQTLVNTAPGTTSNSAMSSPGGQTNVTIQAMDSKSFTEFLARPDNTKAVGNTVVASTRNAGVRRSLAAR